MEDTTVENTFLISDRQDDTLMKLQSIHDSCNYYTTLDNVQMNDNFCIIHLNARSMKNKRDEIIEFLVRSDVQWDIISISETWLKDDIVKYYDIEKYNLFASCRKIGEGGGTALYIHSKHDVKRNDLESKEFETTFVEVKFATKSGKKNIVVGEIYRPPKSNNVTFLSYVEKTLDMIENERKLCLLAGDFNYNFLPVFQNIHTNDFATLMTAYGFFPLISKATRIQNESESLLDNVFINDLSTFCSSGVFVEDLSDHFPIFASLKFTNVEKLDRKCVTVFDKGKMADLNDFLLLRLANFQKNNDANMASKELLEA